MLLAHSTWPAVEAYLRQSTGIIVPMGSTVSDMVNMAALAAAGYEGPQAVTALIERQCWSRAAKNALAGRLTAEAAK